MDFSLASPIVEIEVIATGQGVRIRNLLNRQYGKGRWRKMRGNATVRFLNGSLRLAEIHWYEAHGIGRRDLKIKRFLEQS
jgi:hypothetical protein